MHETEDDCKLNVTETIVHNEDTEEYAPVGEVIEEIESAYATIKNFHKRLLYFTLKIIRIYFYKNTAEGETAEDVLQTVIDKILREKRKWYRNKIPDFVKFLRLTILSYLRNKCKKKKKDALDFTDDLFDQEGNYREEILLLKDIDGKKCSLEFERLVDECFERYENDELTFFVFDLRMRGERSNIKIAEILNGQGFNVEVRDVENALKKIKYHINIKLINKNRTEQQVRNR